MKLPSTSPAQPSTAARARPGVCCESSSRVLDVARSGEMLLQIKWPPHPSHPTPYTQHPALSALTPHFRICSGCCCLTQARPRLVRSSQAGVKMSGQCRYSVVITIPSPPVPSRRTCTWPVWRMLQPQPRQYIGSLASLLTFKMRINIRQPSQPSPAQHSKHPGQLSSASRELHLISQCRV